MTAPDMVSIIAAALVTHYSDSAMPADLDSTNPHWIASCDCDWEGTAANHSTAEALHAAHQARAVLAAISEAGTVEYSTVGSIGSGEFFDDKYYAQRHAYLKGGHVVSRITFPWERAE